MICVECSYPDIQCLHSEFQSKYVRLTICPQCSEVADRYVEFDNVILFLDIMLLKPQAYRHLAFNVVEDRLFSLFGLAPVSFFERYKALNRFIVLSILFEVYLMWAYEEKSTTHSLMKAQILQYSAAWQYSLFIIQQLVEKLTLCSLVIFVFMGPMEWGLRPNKNLLLRMNTPYHVCVLLLTILLSLAVKSLPIIMLIWPYDNIAVASAAVDILGVFNTIEATRIITNCSYPSTALNIIASTILLIFCKQVVLSVIVSRFSTYTAQQLFKDEFGLVKRLAQSMVALLAT